MSFLNRVNSAIEGVAGKEKDTHVLRSGFDVLDYRNARVSKGRVLPGFELGRYILIVGKSGTGKTTLAQQMLVNISEAFNYEVPIIHNDFERSSSKLRVVNLGNDLTEELVDTFYQLRNSEISTESNFNAMKEIKNLILGKDSSGKVNKEINTDDFLTTNPWTGEKMHYPSLFLTDSVLTMYGEKVDVDSVGQDGMLANRVAKTNNEFFQKQLGLIFDGNILPVYVNHIRSKIQTGMTKEAADINWLKQDETLPGVRI